MLTKRNQTQIWMWVMLTKQHAANAGGDPNKWGQEKKNGVFLLGIVTVCKGKKPSATVQSRSLWRPRRTARAAASGRPSAVAGGKRRRRRWTCWLAGAADLWKRVVVLLNGYVRVNGMARPCPCSVCKNIFLMNNGAPNKIKRKILLPYFLAKKMKIVVILKE